METANQQSQPDFQALLNRLTKAVDNSSELTSRAYYAATNLKEIPSVPTVETKSDIVKEPRGVIEFLNAQVYKLEASNSKLLETTDHLTKLIGS